MLFNVFAKYGYITSEFCRAVIIPLVKNKNGNLTDVNNYRAIAISNAITKLLEEIILKYLDSVMKLTTTNLVSKRFFDWYMYVCF